MHAFSQVNRTGIARSTGPVSTQNQSQNSPPLRMQVRTTIRSKHQTKIHRKTVEIRAQFRRKSSQGVPEAVGGPSVAQERQEALQERPQAAQRAPLEAHKEMPRAAKAAQRAPKGSQEGLEGRLNRPQVGIRREKSQIYGKCSAPLPC